MNGWIRVKRHNRAVVEIHMARRGDGWCYKAVDSMGREYGRYTSEKDALAMYYQLIATWYRGQARLQEMRDADFEIEESYRAANRPAARKAHA